VIEIQKVMKGKPQIIGAAIVAVSLLFGCSTTPPPKPSDYRLAVPRAEADRDYLGLPQEGATFRLEDIRCEVLVIDCFDMYCHLCQAGAKHVNELFRMVRERGLDKRVKFIGLGAGDTPLEVATYKGKFEVPFPLFPDRRSVVVRQFGELKLPNLIILRNQGGKLEVLHQSSGPAIDPSKILSHIQTDLSQVQPHRWEDTAQTTQPTCAAGASGCRDPARQCAPEPQPATNAH
jgi:hypothetical protein